MPRADKKTNPDLRAVKPGDSPPVTDGTDSAPVPSAAPSVKTTPPVAASTAPAAKTPGRTAPAPSAPDPEVVAAPRRRTFSAEFKRQILAAADACTELGEVGALLRQHGLYSSHLTEWRRQRDEGLRPKKRGRKANGQRALAEENAKLRREKARLEERLAQAEVIIDVQKKLSVLLGIPLKTPGSDGSDE